MNNRYLYKAKRKDNGEWIEGYYACIRPYHYIMLKENFDTWFEIDEKTLCQCTEIGKEVGIDGIVWENEIYQWQDAAFGKCTGIIRYGKYLQDGSGNEYPEIACYGFYAEIVKVEPYPGLDITDYPTYLKMISVLEIFIRNSCVTLIGNIFDNPELLEGGEN